MTDAPNLAHVDPEAFIDAIPHLAAGDRNAFTSELIRGIVGAMAGKTAGDAAGNAIQAALEGKFDSPSDKLFRRALAVLEEEQARDRSTERIATRLRESLGSELSDILAQLVRVQINTQSEVLEKLEVIRSAVAANSRNRENHEALRTAYSALDRRFETYGLAAKNLRDRFEYETKLLLSAFEGADEALTDAVIKYNETYEDLRVNQQAYLDSVRCYLNPESKATALLSLVYSSLLDDVHRRGFLGLNRNRAEILEFCARPVRPSASAKARAEAAEAKVAIMDRLRMSLKDISDSLEGLDRQLGLLRSSIAEHCV